MVTIDKESGFCFGVVTAIDKAEEELRHSGSLYCLGDIVHNGQEVNRLAALGLKTIDHEQMASLHRVKVLLRAHGEPPSTYETARENDIEIIDASCPVVLGLQKRIRKQYEEIRGRSDSQIVIFGKPGHAEVVGLEGQTENTAIVIEHLEDVDRLDLTKNTYLFSQTTKDVEEFAQLVGEIQKRFKGQEFVWKDTICRQVSSRSRHIQEFARQNDIVFFVGGKKSSNGKVLFELCRQANPQSYFISGPEEITEEQIEASKNKAVGICGATSTPLWLMEKCKERLS
jgi:4-hydroxy-3-methylbut-2-enyl diphosphate reductase